MSTIKSSNEHLTLNADGSSKDIKFQANGVEKASISSAGAFTSTTIDATKLTGNLPAISGAALTGVEVAGISSSADATAITINSSENVGIGTSSPSQKLTISGGSVAIDDGEGYRFGNGDYRIEGKDDGANARIGFVTNNSEIARFTADGLTFNGDTASANALDDYEKGSWTPQVSLNDSTTVSGLTQDSGSNGVYTKIGNVVTVHFYLGITAKGTTTSGAFVKLEGLPFTVANSLTSTSLDSGNGQISYYSGTSGIHGMSVVCVGGGTTAFFYRRSTSDTDLAGRMDNNDILNNFNIRGTITYQST